MHDASMLWEICRLPTAAPLHPSAPTYKHQMFSNLEDEYGPEPQASKPPSRLLSDESKESVYNLLKSGPLTYQQMVKKLPISIYTIRSAIRVLTKQGRVKFGPLGFKGLKTFMAAHNG